MGLRELGEMRPVRTPGLPTSLPEGLAIVGRVINDVHEPAYIEWQSIVSRVRIDDKWVEAIGSLTDYSHVMVVFWMDYAMICKPLHVPQGKYDDVPEVGILACRCPYRPNPIGVTTTELIGREGNDLLVRGLDAIDGTAVIDVKPYTPQVDAPRGPVRVPPWVDRLVY